jgi:hypothetical protein
MPARIDVLEMDVGNIGNLLGQELSDQIVLVCGYTAWIRHVSELVRIDRDRVRLRKRAESGAHVAIAPIEMDALAISAGPNLSASRNELANALYITARRE